MWILGFAGRPTRGRSPPRDRPPRIGVCSLSLACQKLGRRNAEPIRQIEKPFVEQTPFAEFDVDQNVSRHA